MSTCRSLCFCQRTICQYNEDHPKATVQEVHQYIMNDFSIELRKSTIGDILKDKHKWLDKPADSLDMMRYCNWKTSSLKMHCSCGFLICLCTTQPSTMRCLSWRPRHSVSSWTSPNFVTLEGEFNALRIDEESNASCTRGKLKVQISALYIQAEINCSKF